MKDNAIRQLYLALNPLERLDEFPEYNEITAKLNDAMETNLRKEDYEIIDPLVCDFAFEAEAAGFITGFRLATQIMSECFQRKESDRPHPDK